MAPKIGNGTSVTAAAAGAAIPAAVTSSKRVGVEDEGSKFFGHYRVEKMLGKGSYGKVKLATNLKTNEKVALKFILKSSIKKEAHLTRIKREVRLLKLLHHPHIVKLHEASETNQEIILTMEHAPGGELFDYIVAQKRVKEPEARRLFRQIISAVDYCHQNCVIHRDLKPENLLLDASRNIKIIDFGFANTFDPDGLLGTFCGSPYYASPEMITGQKYIGPEVDIWSLGVILYALLCGCLPFEEEHMKELYAKIMAGKYSVPSHVSSAAKDLIQRMITVDPKQRATIAEIKAHRWVLQEEGPVNSFLPPRPVLAEVDEAVVQKLLTYGYDKETVKQRILNEPKSPAFCAYYLVKERAEREVRAKSAVHEEESVKRKEEEDKNSKEEGEGSEGRKRGESVIATYPPPALRKLTGTAAPASTTTPSLNLQMGSPQHVQPGVEKQGSARRFSFDGAAQFVQSAAQNAAQLFRKRNSNNHNAQTSGPEESVSSGSIVPTAVNGLFNVSTTSTKPPSEIAREIVRVLKHLEIPFSQQGSFFFSCVDGKTRFEVEICRIDRLDLYGLHLKRLEGDSWHYKKLCAQFTTQLKL